jgi:hypothetical protein
VSTVGQIKTAIESLSPRERAELNAWLQGWKNDDWDDQMSRDAKAGGKLDKLRELAESEARDGRLRDFPEPHPVQAEQTERR